MQVYSLVDVPHHLRELSDSYGNFVRQGKLPTKYSVGNRILEVRDCSPEDIANIALRDEEKPFFNAFYFRRRSIADSDRPDYPLGFSLSRMSSEEPEALEASYAYVNQNWRGRGLGLVETIDTLLHALGVDTKLLVAQVIKGTSKFYESLGGISSSEEAVEGRKYKIQLQDKKKVKDLLEERMRKLGVVIL